MLNYNDIQQLGQTYNTLTLINTKGEDTVYMAECLKALKQLYFIFGEEYNLQQENQVEEENNNE